MVEAIGRWLRKRSEATKQREASSDSVVARDDFFSTACGPWVSAWDAQAIAVVQGGRCMNDIGVSKRYPRARDWDLGEVVLEAGFGRRAPRNKRNLLK
jgi:hypothetical protein